MPLDKIDRAVRDLAPEPQRGCAKPIPGALSQGSIMLLQDRAGSAALPTSPTSSVARHLAVATLQRLSQALAGLAVRMLRAEPAGRCDPVVEFYAEAGAPEGALYLDGQFVARLPGVKRL